MHEWMNRSSLLGIIPMNAPWYSMEGEDIFALYKKKARVRMTRRLDQLRISFQIVNNCGVRTGSKFIFPCASLSRSQTLLGFHSVAMIKRKRTRCPNQKIVSYRPVSYSLLLSFLFDAKYDTPSEVSGFVTTCHGNHAGAIHLPRLHRPRDTSTLSIDFDYEGLCTVNRAGGRSCLLYAIFNLRLRNGFSHQRWSRAILKKRTKRLKFTLAK